MRELLTGVIQVILLLLIPVYVDNPTANAMHIDAKMTIQQLKPLRFDRNGTVIAKTTPEIAIIAFD